MLTGNIGEWSEIYTFFKLLADGKLHTANVDLSLDPKSYYPIVKIIREQRDFSYDYVLDDQVIQLVCINKSGAIRSISRADFATAANNLLVAISTAHGTFRVPAVEEILDLAEITALTEPHSDKGDIALVSHDSRVNQNVNLSFSIKSQLGSASTLLNASGATTFQFVLNKSLSITEITSLNLLGVKDLMKALIASGQQFQLSELRNSQFTTNLKMIDSEMPQIIANILIAYYSSRGTTMTDLLATIIADDPLKYGLAAPQIYTHKVKTFLADVALGMTPSRPWTGEYDATGGYIIVKQNGEIVCFHAYNRNAFRDYLLNSTKLETASTSRHRFGKVYSQGTDCHIDLNLQIRFI